MVVASSRDMAVIVDLARLVTPRCQPKQAPTERDVLKLSGSSIAAT
jgi:hypothetical protein